MTHRVDSEWDKEVLDGLHATLASVEEDLRGLMLSWEDEEDLEPEQQEKRAAFIKEYRDDYGSFGGFLNERALSFEFTAFPAWGSRSRSSRPVAKFNQFFASLVFGTGGPHDEARARVEFGGRIMRVTDIDWIYMWSGSYEMPVTDRELWQTVFDDLLELYSPDEIVEKLNENGEYVCPVCYKWYEDTRVDSVGGLCLECQGKTCSDCGEEYDKDELFDTDKGRLCENCLPQNGLGRCSVCGDVHESWDLIGDDDGNEFCDDCAEESAAE